MTAVGDASAPMEPSPPEPPPARLTHGAFPSYRYIPGHSPHPRRDRSGHSWAAPEPRVSVIDDATWSGCSLYLRGADLFNHAFWWESHEAFEALWRGSAPPASDLLQALIQVAASEIKRFSGANGAASTLTAKALVKLGALPSPCLGLDVRAFEDQVRERQALRRTSQPVIDLAF
jgi:uncharacterized protein